MLGREPALRLPDAPHGRAGRLPRPAAATAVPVVAAAPAAGDRRRRSGAAAAADRPAAAATAAERDDRRSRPEAPQTADLQADVAEVLLLTEEEIRPAVAELGAADQRRLRRPAT